MSTPPPSHHDYAAFLPPAHRSNVTDPTSTWWTWRDHRVHIARRRNPHAPARLLLVHGAGGHSGALWPYVSLLPHHLVDIAAVDLPLYGRTHTPDPGSVRYETWLQLLTDLIHTEDDGRPLVLFGASIGGMLAHELTTRTAPATVQHVAVTCLLDPRDTRVRATITRYGPLGVVLAPLSRLAIGPLARIRIPINWVAPLNRMSRNPGLSRLCATDPRGGGARAPLGFLTSWMHHRHRALQHSTVPLTLLHPARDNWTPPALSQRALTRANGPTRTVMLDECGHFPIEEPGLSTLIHELSTLISDLKPGRPSPRHTHPTHAPDNQP